MSARATGGAKGSTDPEEPQLEEDLVDDDEVDPFADGEDADPTDLTDGLEEELDDAEEEEEDGEEDGKAGETGLDELAADDDSDDDEAEPTITVVPPDAEFDDDAPIAPVEEEDGEEDEIEGLRDGEFVCRGCFMAKRETQLADPEKLLCRDCA